MLRGSRRLCTYRRTKFSPALPKTCWYRVGPSYRHIRTDMTWLRDWGNITYMDVEGISLIMMLNSRGASDEPCGRPFRKRRKRLHWPSLVLSLKLRFERMLTINRTICLSRTTHRSFRVRPWCHTESYAAVRSTSTRPAFCFSSKQAPSRQSI